MPGYRAYLRRIAQGKIGEALRAKVDESDIVQQALLQAHQSIADYRGATRAEMAGWLRQILARVLSHTLRDLRRAKRDAAQDRPLQAAIDQSTACVDAWLADGSPSPSERIIAREETARLVEALKGLSEDHREVIALRYNEGLTLAEIATVMQRSQTATAGLLHRALSSLKKIMGDGMLPKPP